MPKRYGWLGATRTKAVCDIASSCFDAWLRDWYPRHEASEASIGAIPLASCPLQEYATWVGELADGHLLVALNRKLLDTFGGHLAMADAERSDGVAVELARAALQDLLERLAARAGHLDASPVSWDAAWPDSILHPEWGGLALQISFDEFELLIGMDRSVIDVISPAQARIHDALSSRAESLGPLPVILSAVLDFGSVSASDVAGLRVGEVLVSERTVGEPIALHAGRRHVFNANLAQADHQFAIVATALSTGEGS